MFSLGNMGSQALKSNAISKGYCKKVKNGKRYTVFSQKTISIQIK